MNLSKKQAKENRRYLQQLKKKQVKAKVAPWTKIQGYYGPRGK